MADSKKIRIKFTEETEKGLYANAVSVHVNKSEVVLDFAYTLPNIGAQDDMDQIIKVISRINMTHTTAESFMKVLTNAILDWKNKQKENEGSDSKG